MDLSARTLRCQGRLVPLQNGPFELLVLLVANPGTLVTRDAIRAAIWPDVVVAYDQNINFAIRQIRIALGPEAGRIQTVPRRGYRFGGPVTASSRVRQQSAALVAGMAVALSVVFGAGILTAHTASGAFIYEHLVHPDHCPYFRQLVSGLRNL